MPSATGKTHASSHLKDLILLFSVPAAIALIAASIVYIPRLLANPTSDFIYASCLEYRCNNTYTVDSAGVVQASSGTGYYDRDATLHYYDAANDATKSLTLEQAQQYQLNTLSKSPDGYTLMREDSNSGFLFWVDYDEGWYLKNGAKKKRLPLTSTNAYYSRDVMFLGWVTNDD